MKLLYVDYLCFVWLSFSQFSGFYKPTILNSLLQVAFYWSGISSVHVDDFLRCGTEQMLLLFKDQDVTGPLLNNFFLTDLCGISYSVSCHCSISWGCITVTRIFFNKVQM